MAASEEFKAALKEGKIVEALKTALGESIELDIKTWISPSEHSEADSTASSEQLAYRMRTKINILEGQIETEIGSNLLENGQFAQLREFHTAQIQSSMEVIEKNISSLRKLVGLWVEMQQGNFVPTSKTPQRELKGAGLAQQITTPASTSKSQEPKAFSAETESQGELPDSKTFTTSGSSDSGKEPASAQITASSDRDEADVLAAFEAPSTDDLTFSSDESEFAPSAEATASQEELGSQGDRNSTSGLKTAAAVGTAAVLGVAGAAAVAAVAAAAGKDETAADEDEDEAIETLDGLDTEPVGETADTELTDSEAQMLPDLETEAELGSSWDDTEILDMTPESELATEDSEVQILGALETEGEGETSITTDETAEILGTLETDQELASNNSSETELATAESSEELLSGEDYEELADPFGELSGEEETPAEAEAEFPELEESVDSSELWPEEPLGSEAEGILEDPVDPSELWEEEPLASEAEELSEELADPFGELSSDSVTPAEAQQEFTSLEDSEEDSAESSELWPEEPLAGEAEGIDEEMDPLEELSSPSVTLDEEFPSLEDSSESSELWPEEPLAGEAEGIDEEMDPLGELGSPSVTPGEAEEEFPSLEDSVESSELWPEEPLGEQAEGILEDSETPASAQEEFPSLEDSVESSELWPEEPLGEQAEGISSEMDPFGELSEDSVTPASAEEEFPELEDSVESSELWPEDALAEEAEGISEELADPFGESSDLSELSETVADEAIGVGELEGIWEEAQEETTAAVGDADPYANDLQLSDSLEESSAATEEIAAVSESDGELDALWGDSQDGETESLPSGWDEQELAEPFGDESSESFEVSGETQADDLASMMDDGMQSSQDIESLWDDESAAASTNSLEVPMEQEDPFADADGLELFSENQMYEDQGLAEGSSEEELFSGTLEEDSDEDADLMNAFNSTAQSEQGLEEPQPYPGTTGVDLGLDEDSEVLDVFGSDDEESQAPQGATEASTEDLDALGLEEFDTDMFGEASLWDEPHENGADKGTAIENMVFDEDQEKQAETGDDDFDDPLAALLAEEENQQESPAKDFESGDEFDPLAELFADDSQESDPFGEKPQQSESEGFDDLDALFDDDIKGDNNSDPFIELASSDTNSRSSSQKKQNR